MSARIPTLRAVRAARPLYHPQTQTRPLSFGPKEGKDADYSNPLLQKYMASERQRAMDAAAATKHKALKKKGPPEIPEGSLNDHTSLFNPLAEKLAARAPALVKDAPAPDTPEGQALQKQLDADEAARKEKHYAALRHDPDPAGRALWEREMVIKAIQKRGRMTKDEKVKRTERSLTWRSDAVPGSTKKLTKIMNQIAGKTVDEAMVQLRFCKKKAAQDIMRGLQIARARAVAERGMGLGAVKKAEVEGAEDVLPYGDYLAPKPTVGETIELKDGRKKLVTDPTEIYVDQAWVGPGIMQFGFEARARGKINRLRHRTTNFAFILKEEKTRMRISDEIKAKRDAKKVWTALPDRPVIAQKQYCLW